MNNIIYFKIKTIRKHSDPKSLWKNSRHRPRPQNSRIDFPDFFPLRPDALFLTFPFFSVNKHQICLSAVVCGGSESSGQDRIRIRIMIHSAILRPESLRPSAPDPKPRKPRRCYITSCQPPGRTIHGPEFRKKIPLHISASNCCILHFYWTNSTFTAGTGSNIYTYFTPLSFLFIYLLFKKTPHFWILGFFRSVLLYFAHAQI